VRRARSTSSGRIDRSANRPEFRVCAKAGAPVCDVILLAWPNRFNESTFQRFAARASRWPQQ
jgi:hypothetical protein